MYKEKIEINKCDFVMLLLAETSMAAEWCGKLPRDIKPSDAVRYVMRDDNLGENISWFKK